MNATIPISSEALWFIEPSRMPDAIARMESARAERHDPEPVSKRPKMDYWGNDLAQMRFVGSTAIVPVSGPMYQGATGSDKRAGVCSYDDIVEDVNAARLMGARAIVMHISSPGGGAIGCSEVAGFVKDTAKQVPIYSFTDSMQCSAAEYLSAACSARFATPSAIVGSIGTVMQFVSFQGFLEKNGIKASVITSGKFKAAGSPLKDLTPDQAEYFQALVDHMADEFKGWMSKHRQGMSGDSMQGQMFTGRQGAQNGLIDATASCLGEVLRLIG